MAFSELPGQALFRRQAAMASSVLRLLTFRGPATVSWFIIASVINAINRVFGCRTAPHILKKIGIVEPAHADRNASPAIVLIGANFWIGATLTQADPYSPLGRSMCLAMRARSFASHFSLKASAGLSAPLPQVRADNKAFRSAVAEAEPIAGFHMRDGDQTAKPFADDVNETRHKKRRNRQIRINQAMFLAE